MPSTVEQIERATEVQAPPVTAVPAAAQLGGDAT